MAYKCSNLAELLYSSDSGLQMMAFAFQKGLKKCNRECYAFRETIIKKYRAGEMHIGDLYENTIRQMTYFTNNLKSHPTPGVLTLRRGK